MINVIVKLQKGECFGREHIDRALKRLKQKVDNEGVLETVRVKRAFENETEKRRRKAKRLAKQRKLLKLQRQQEFRN
jgi:small subunit ribosomal protein S21